MMNNTINTTVTNNNAQEETTMKKRGFFTRLRENTYTERAKIAAEKAASKVGDINVAVTKKVSYGEGYAIATVSESLAEFEIYRRTAALVAFTNGVRKAEEKKAERKEDKVINKALANVQ